MLKRIKGKLDLIVEKSFKQRAFRASAAAERNALVNARECLRRPLTMKSNPVRVRLELTNACNLNCVFCYRPHFSTRDRSLLTPEHVERLAPILRTAKFVSLSQKAEPLASPHFIKVLEKVSVYKPICSLYTNGQLLSREISEALVKNRVHFVTVSLSAYGDKYARLHRGGRFDKLVSNIKTLNEIKKRRRSVFPRLRISFVLRPDTVEFLEDAVRFAKEYKFSEGVQLLSFFRFTDEDKSMEPALNWRKYEGAVRSFRALAEREGVMLDSALDVEDGMRSAVVSEYAARCYEPWESYNVTPGGSVLPCTQAGAVMSNMITGDPLAIWNNKKFQAYRSHMTCRPFNRDCLECWHCRYVSPLVTGKKAARLDRIFDTFHRR
ncbi:MAG: hypothetical protein A2234_06540 [Elusimicrobia bacterium RIFOXYA2_FULL_58_8]|nr:MAG: hypothetical protein A2285_06260 [Elusimicrobia bacterium RIFOXYA12_FULL_57_11]OGS16147.1 MAG: hypothetical protein A2234_06540 [Elusimicrobia bacterium RIFOXYA2_FULL_58_8]